jgi:hypothetical protein
LGRGANAAGDVVGFGDAVGVGDVVDAVTDPVVPVGVVTAGDDGDVSPAAAAAHDASATVATSTATVAAPGLCIARW